MIEIQQDPSIEAADVRVHRVDRALTYWLAKGYAYAALSVCGTARPFRTGQLQLALQLVARHSGARLIELATDRDSLMSWALTPRPVTNNRKGYN